MQLYTERNKKTFYVEGNNQTAPSAWLAGGKSTSSDSANKGGISGAVGSAVKSIQESATAGNSYEGIPTIRNRLQYREESAQSILNFNNTSNIYDVVKRRVAQNLYGAVNSNSDLYRQINEEYHSGTETNGRPLSFFSKIWATVAGSSGTQANKYGADKIENDIVKLGLKGVRDIALSNFKKYLINSNYKPTKNPEKFEAAVQNLSDFSLTSLSEVLKLSGPAETIEDIASMPGLLYSMASTVASTASAFNPASTTAVCDAINDAVKEGENIYEKFRGKFQWIKNFVTNETLLGPSNSLVGDIESLRARIMGLPPAMLNAVDPLSRAYNNNVIATQHVMTIVPGIFDYAGIAWSTNYGFSKTALEEEMKAFENGTAQTLVFDGQSAVRQFMDLLNDKNHRLANFSPRVGAFLRIYNTLMGRFIARLSPTSTAAMMIPGYGPDNEAEFNKTLITTGWGGIEFAINSNTTVSETVSNSWSQGKTESMLQTYNSALNTGKKVFTGIFGSNATDAFDIKTSVTNFPKHWDDSSFSKSYTLSFRLECPYGNTDHLLEYVYKPFAALLTLSLPVFKTENSLSAPFIVRVDCPGFFTIDAGAITSLDIRRGVDENSWSAQGMATCLEITMTIMDMYEKLASPVGPSSLLNNYPMQAYIDNISGMNYKEIYTGGTMSAALRTYASYAKSLPDVYKQTIMARASEKVWKLPTSLWDSGRKR